MPKVNHEPDSNRRQTRAANANAHPGRVVMDVLGGRRKQEDIEKDKEAKKGRREARERKKVEKQVAIGAIAEFENRMALDDEIQGTKFPRRQSEGKSSDSFVIYMTHNAPSVDVPTKPKVDKKRKVGAKDLSGTGGNIMAVSYTNEKRSNTHQGLSELDERSDPGDDGHQTMAKKLKISEDKDSGPRPLCRTGLAFVSFSSKKTLTHKLETYIQPEGQFPINTPMPVTRTMAYTPKPKRIITQSRSEEESSQTESEDDNFETPRALKTKVPTDAEFIPDSDFGETTGVDLTTGVESSERSDGQNEESDTAESDGSDIYERRSATNHKAQEIKTIDLAKMQKKGTGKDKRAFRKEIGETRVLIMKDKDKVRGI